ncbi:MAG: OmpA family protein [Janthinobacterium lividum]
MRRGLVLGAMLMAVAAAGCTRLFVDTPPKSVVFFNAFSAELDAPAQGVIREFATDARTAPTRRVTVLGYADAAGSPDANRMLSALRAKVVSDALVTQGIAPNRITQRPRGATDTDPGIESRRVEIELGR